MALASFGADTLPTVLNAFSYQGIVPKADGATGALTESIKIDVPPGRNGMQPDVSLKYNSQSGEDSIVGYGWTVSIPYIQRLNKTGSQDLYYNPYFTSSFDGELATTSTTSYGAKFDEGNFNAYSFVNNVWTMYDKNGTRYTFGASDNAQQNASASSTIIYKWMLQEIRDTNNNYVRYIYTKDSGQIYPAQILYTGNGGIDGIFSVDFTKSSRSDTYTNYLPGFLATTNYRISKVTASVNGTIVREYNLAYTTGINGVRSLLSSVQENGWDANHTNQVTLPAMTLTYSASTTAFAWPTGLAGSGNGVGSSQVIADANGDGMTDVTSMQLSQVSGQTSATIWDKGNLFSIGFVSPAPEYWSLTQNGCDAPRPEERFADINGDGLVDFIRGYRMDQPTANFAPRGEVGIYRLVLLNTGTGWATSTAYSIGDIALADVQSGNWGGNICHSEYGNWTGNGQNAQDVLSTVTYPQGGTETITYVKSAQSGTNVDLPFSLLTVARIVKSDGLGMSVQKDYTYSGGLMNLTHGVRDRKFSGFANSTESDANTITKTYFNQGDTVNMSLGEQSDGYGQINHPFRIDVMRASDNQLVRQTFSRWDATSTFASNTTFVNLASWFYCHCVSITFLRVGPISHLRSNC